MLRTLIRPFQYQRIALPRIVLIILNGASTHFRDKKKERDVEDHHPDVFILQ